MSASIALIKDGKLRALAKLNNRPLPSLPDLKPLSVAANLPELGGISTWAGLVAPADTWWEVFRKHPDAMFLFRHVHQVRVAVPLRSIRRW